MTNFAWNKLLSSLNLISRILKKILSFWIKGIMLKIWFIILGLSWTQILVKLLIFHLIRLRRSRMVAIIGFLTTQDTSMSKQLLPKSASKIPTRSRFKAGESKAQTVKIVGKVSNSLLRQNMPVLSSGKSFSLLSSAVWFVSCLEEVEKTVRETNTLNPLTEVCFKLHSLTQLVIDRLLSTAAVWASKVPPCRSTYWWRTSWRSSTRGPVSSSRLLTTACSLTKIK